MKLKKGDIILNRWAGTVGVAYFIYTSTSGRYINGLQLWNGRISKCQYYKSSLGEDFPDGQPAYVKVGHTDAFNVMKRDLLENGENWEEQRAWKEQTNE